MRAEASSFLHVLEEHDPSAPCPMCINGDAGTCSSLETRDGAVDEAYEQAEGPEGSEIDREERKSIVQARARDMDDERTPCVIQEQHRLQEQLEDESHSVKEDESTCLVESKEVRTSQAGGHFRRAGQLRVTREPGPSDDTEMLKTAGYGSQGARESGKGYGDVYWEGGTPMFLTEDKARNMFEHGVAGPTDAAKIREGESGKLAELTCDETRGSLDQKEVHSKILRALKEEGEMDSLRRTNHPGGQLANERFTRSKSNRASDKDTEKQTMNKGGIAKGRTDEEPRSS
ncbi:hypothetical protein NSK_006158 [Nannochloropsis salina CCMP1776]|uniref:Uncharacterized protein n=1 Tax=Nannochloropsis salina CCMP1776 TaxID=1027361 RepID=A0A4D9D1K3_9STRA|nr:hypothetical protein NSK_006158 [Nannochloropsis salina CCMP1776]|eukprot:TFJ82528.1 hypothetical protein NSK_006158 [Nannochloropsis salina CCMP1776]